MSSYREALRAARGRQDGDGCIAPEGLREEYPELADVLCGVAAADGEAAIPAATVTLYVKDGRLRFSVGGKDADVCFFGEVADASKGLLGVEEALSRGALGVKHDRRKK
jgi:hypothetical protein